MSCSFYGRIALPKMKALVATAGNQCGLIPAAYVPCSMQHAGQAVDWEKCDLNGCRRAEQFLTFLTIAPASAKAPDA